MRKTALGTDRRPAHCFSVQDDDELGQLGMVTKLIFRPQPRQGPPRCWGPLPFQPPTECPAVFSGARGFDFVGGALTPLSRHSANSQEGPEDLTNAAGP